MSRLPYAAKTLISQLRDRYPDLEYEAGEPDGFGVRRDVTFDAETSDFIDRVDMAFLDDPRIDHFSKSKDRVTVHFTSHARADRRETFPLAAALELLEDEEPAPTPVARKATPKKRTAKS